MQVENIECQIAKAQIGNYLAGAGLSEEALTQLEEHLGACADCKKTLDARRNELLSLLAEEPKPTADMNEEPTGSATSIAAALRKKSLQAMSSRVAVTASAPVPETPVAQAAVEATETATNVKAATFWKPLMYSLALGAVLVGMSMFSKNASGVLGNKLSDSLPTTPTASVKPPVTTAPKSEVLNAAPPVTVAKAEPAKTTVPVAPNKVATPPTAAATATKPISPAPKQPVTQAAPRAQTAPTTTTGPAPVVHATVARRWAPRRYRSARRASAHRGTRRARPSGIKIYDPSGKPL